MPGGGDGDSELPDGTSDRNRLDSFKAPGAWKEIGQVLSKRRHVQEEVLRERGVGKGVNRIPPGLDGAHPIPGFEAPARPFRGNLTT